MTLRRYGKIGVRVQAWTLNEKRLRNEISAKEGGWSGEPPMAARSSRLSRCTRSLAREPPSRKVPETVANRFGSKREKAMTHTMTTDHAAIGVYSNHVAAEAAVRTLEQVGISLDKISIVGGVSQAREASLGHYVPPIFVERGVQHQAEREGMKLGGVLGMLVGFSSFFIPGIGMLLVLGPVTGLLTGAGAGAAMGAVVGAMSFHDIAAGYRDWLVAGSYLVIVHCTTAEEPGVSHALRSTEPLSTKTHRLMLHTSPQVVATGPSRK